MVGFGKVFPRAHHARETEHGCGQMDYLWCENPPFEAGYGIVSPSAFASWVSSILAGRSLGRVQFLNRCGITA